MEIVSAEYNIYNNIFEYFKIIKFVPTDAKKKERVAFMKTMQFYNYVKIRATHQDGRILYAFLLKRESGFTKITSEFKSILNTIKETDINLLTFSEKPVKRSVRLFINKKSPKKIKFQGMLFKHFKVIPMNNKLVPKHTLCSSREMERVMQDNCIIHPLHFPKIHVTDPQVIWIDGKLGDLVKIQRQTDIGHVLYYRIIV